MRAFLEFDLDTPEDRDEHRRATSATSAYICLWEVDQYFRSRIKYNDSLTDEAVAELETARAQLHDILREHGVNLDDLS